MEETLSLSWEAHQNNICSGLSLLQQRGEFVDMTLAADGHHVKVHQMIMSLVSPYIKELISSAQCPHPVIFLNNISYNTLHSLLEYVYTGEVLLPKEKLPDLLAAGKALHIKGLREMEDSSTPHSEATTETLHTSKTLVGHLRDNKENKKHNVKCKYSKRANRPDRSNFDSENDAYMEEHAEPKMSATIETLDEESLDTTIGRNKSLDILKKKEYSVARGIQYSISNQGGLQVIINRYIYNLKYVQKNMNRYWRCVDYAYKKCPANVYTNDKNEVLKRKCTHNHPFHDGKILKKVRSSLIFTAFKEAESRARDKKEHEAIEIVTVLPSSHANDTE